MSTNKIHVPQYHSVDKEQLIASMSKKTKQLALRVSTNKIPYYHSVNIHNTLFSERQQTKHLTADVTRQSLNTNGINEWTDHDYRD